MGEAFESIMRGLGEVKAHREGKLTLKNTAIEIAPLPVYDAKAGRSDAPVTAKHSVTDRDRQER